MQRARLKYVFLLFLFINCASSVGQLKPVNTQAKAKEFRLDRNSAVKVQYFNKAKIEEYKNQRDFKYDTISDQLSLWDRFWIWFWRKIGDLLGSAARNPISKYFFIGVGIAIVAFILYKIIGADALFSKKSKETFLPYEVLNENIHEIDYQKELARLVADRKYRLAVRLLYLQTLKKLSDKEIIDWKLEKTNYNYLMEINEPTIKAEFGQLTYQFDYIWYGDFPVDKPTFEPINQSFSHFNAELE